MTIAGGSVFWLLIALAVIAVITYIERLLDLRRAQIDYSDFMEGVINVMDAGSADEALAICDETPSPVASVVATAIRHRNGSARVLRDAVDSQGRAEAGRLDRRLAALAIIAQIAPLLGLLGSIIGFIRTVSVLGSSEVVSRVDLLNGLSEGLVSAALGLAVAIPVVVMYGSLRVRLERTIVELEAAASQIIGYISSAKELAKESSKERAK